MKPDESDGKGLIHRIRLSAAWKMTLVDTTNAIVSDRRVNLPLEIKPQECAGELKLMLIRHFNIPSQLTDESLWLHLSAAKDCGGVVFNGVRLQSDDVEEMEWNVTTLMKAFNCVEIELKTDSTPGRPLRIGEVYLLIRKPTGS